MASYTTLSLQDKVAIVTGSGRENGIGAGIALALARAGARVTINFVSDASASRAADVVRKVESVAGTGTAIAIQADVATAPGSTKIVQETLDRFGVDHIDVIGRRCRRKLDKFDTLMPHF